MNPAEAMSNRRRRAVFTEDLESRLNRLEACPHRKKLEQVLSAIHRSALISDNDDEWKVESELSDELQSVLRDWQATSTIDQTLNFPFLAYTLDTPGATSYDKLLISGVENICNSLGFSVFLSSIKRDECMRYLLGPVQDTHYQPLSKNFIPTSSSCLAQFDFVDCNDCRCRGAHSEISFTVLLVVPDIHAFLQNLLPTSTEHYGMMMFDQICTKILEHREGQNTGDGLPKDHGMAAMLIPVIAQCAGLNKIEMCNRALRGLQGATIDAYSRLLCLVPEIPFSKIVEGLEIAVTSLKSIDERYLGLQKLFHRWSGPVVVVDTDGPEAKISPPLPRSIAGPSSGIFFSKEDDGESLTDTNTASKDLRIALDCFYVAKMEQILTIESILTDRHVCPYKSLMCFVNDVGGDEYFLDQIVPVLHQAPAKTQLIAKFLNKLFADPLVQTVTKMVTVRQILPSMAEQCDVLGRKANPRASGMLDLENISVFILNCYSYGLAGETYGFLQSVIEELDAIKDTEYDEVVIPFLRDIATAWTTSAISESIAYRELFEHALHSYLVKLVKYEPEVLETSRAPIARSCGPFASPCNHCKIINSFLQHPQRVHTVLQFPYDDYHTHILPIIQGIDDLDIVSIRGDGYKYIKVIKLTKCNNYEDKKKQYKERRKVAYAKLQTFGQGVLEKVLGDRFEEISSMSCTMLEPKGPVKRMAHVYALQWAEEQELGTQEGEVKSPSDEINTGIPTNDLEPPPKPQWNDKEGNQELEAQETIAKRLSKRKRKAGQDSDSEEGKGEGEVERQVEDEGENAKIENGDCECYRAPKRAKHKHVDLQDACAMFGM